MQKYRESMVYRFLGNSGLRISVLSFGNWLTGHDLKVEQTQIQLIKSSYLAGINFFDTAQLYGFGNAQKIFGKAIKELYKIGAKREELVISTKLLMSQSDCSFNVNAVGMSRKHIIEGLKNSLKRLDLQYVDVVFSHRPFPDVPIDQVCKGFSWLIDQGLAHYWGTSQWPPQMIIQAILYCNCHNLHRPICEQPLYNAFSRETQEKYQYLFRKYKYGTTIYSPLAGGILSGKFNDGKIPEDSRYATDNELLKNFFSKIINENNKTIVLQKLKKLEALAIKLGYTQSQLCLAWTIVNSDVTTCIFGASKMSHLEDNLKSIELAKKWTQQIENEMEGILKNVPERSLNFRIWKQEKSRRLQAIKYGLKQ